MGHTRHHHHHHTEHQERTEAALSERHHHRAPVPPMHRLQRTLDSLLTVVSADLIVDFGVLITGIILCLIETGLIPSHVFADHGDEPQKVVIVRRDEHVNE